MTTEQKRQHWQQHIEAWRQSQLTQREYCKQQAIPFSCFSYWRTRLNRLAEGQKKLLSVQVPCTTTVAVMLPCGIRLEVPAHALEEILPILTRTGQESA